MKSIFFFPIWPLNVNNRNVQTGRGILNTEFVILFHLVSNFLFHAALFLHFYLIIVYFIIINKKKIDQMLILFKQIIICYPVPT